MLAQIQDFLAQPRIAVAGVSHRPNDFSRTLFREFRNRGYDMVAVNPGAAEIDGAPCYPRIQDVRPGVENVVVMTSAAAAGAVVRDCAAAGVKRVWLYRAGGAGAVSEEAVALCREQGIAVIRGECPLMFLRNTGGIHRFHGWLRKIFGKYPQ